MKNTRLYILPEYINDIKNDSSSKFDLYVARNEATIKGAIELIPTVQFKLMTPNKETIRFSVNPDKFNKIFGFTIKSNEVYDLINYYVDPNLRAIVKREEVFKGNVSWVKQVNAETIKDIILEALDQFLVQEFGVSWDVHDDEKFTFEVKKYREAQWIFTYQVNVNVDYNMLTELLGNNARLTNAKLAYMTSHLPKGLINSILV